MTEALKNIPLVILAGGRGTRIGSGNIIPKPMAEINQVPLLQYIMDYFSGFGFRRFIIALGDGGGLISDYIDKYLRKGYDDENDPVCVYLKNNKADRKSWQITDVPTGSLENTGARIFQLKKYLQNDPCFLLTYGDVYADVNLNELMDFHFSHGKMATVTAVHYPTRFRILGLYGDQDEVRGFADKPVLQKDYINGGFYVLNNNVLDMNSLKQEISCSFELHLLEELVSKKELMAYRFGGYWQSLDTERERDLIGKFIYG